MNRELPRARLYFYGWVGVIVLTAAKTVETQVSNWAFVRDNAIKPAMDFVVFWSAARVPLLDLYDFEKVTAAQSWFTGPGSLRPFAYPPSFLPWLEPFAHIPMLPSFLLWDIVTTAAFLWAWSRIGKAAAIAVGLLMAPSTNMLFAGQATFLIGTLIVSGIAILGSRPLLAGILFGIAATIKPQSVLLIPVALVAFRQWRTLGVAVATGLLIGAACLVLQGPAIWRAWIEVLPAFNALILGSGMIEWGVTPSSAIAIWELTAPLSNVMVVSLAVVGLITVWIIFRNSHDPHLHIMALTCGTLLVLPYAMPYELAIAGPAAATMLSNRNGHPTTWLAGYMVLTGAGIALAPPMMCLTLLGVLIAQRRAEVAAAAISERNFRQGLKQKQPAHPE